MGIGKREDGEQDGNKVEDTTREKDQNGTRGLSGPVWGGRGVWGTLRGPARIRAVQIGLELYRFGNTQTEDEEVPDFATSFAKETTHRKNVFLPKSLLRYSGEAER